MDLYLPIAEMSVNALLIVALGGVVGFLSGMFGVGGGFLTTPLLIFTGIPPAIAVASAASQVTGSSVSGALSYFRRGQVDVKMGLVLVAGGMLGSVLGSFLFDWLKRQGQVDVTIGIVYVIFLGAVGALMLKDSIRLIRQQARGEPIRARARRHHPLVAALPMRMRFPRSGVYISPLAPFLVGAAVGVLTVIMGVGGGFIMVPAMLYLLGMAAGVVVGTSLFQIVFVTAVATLLHATQSQTVDILLAVLLLLGGVVGAQLGARAAQGLPPERLRLFLALLVLAVAVRLLVGLTWTPAELFSIQTAVG
ncbi:MAG: sulfite exporter TauE/SafE family protein [Sphingomonadaceae bacterium]